MAVAVLTESDSMLHDNSSPSISKPKSLILSAIVASSSIEIFHIELFTTIISSTAETWIGMSKSTASVAPSVTLTCSTVAPLASGLGVIVRIP